MSQFREGMVKMSGRHRRGGPRNRRDRHLAHHQLRHSAILRRLCASSRPHRPHGTRRHRLHVRLAEEGTELTRIEMRIDRLLKRDEMPGFQAFSRPVASAAALAASADGPQVDYGPDELSPPAEPAKPRPSPPLLGRGGRSPRRNRRARVMRPASWMRSKDGVRHKLPVRRQRDGSFTPQFLGSKHALRVVRYGPRCYNPGDPCDSASGQTFCRCVIPARTTMFL